MRKNIVIIVSHLVPTYGLERVVLDVVALLGSDFNIRLVQVSGSKVPFEVPEWMSVESLGKDLSGWRRLQTLKRLKANISDDQDDIYILAGVWVAIPWLLVSTKRQRRLSVVWEHSILRERLRFSNKMRGLAVAAALLYRRSAGVVAVSEPVATGFRELPRIFRPMRIWTISNPVEIPSELRQSEDHGSANPGPYRLVTVGSMSKLKAQHLVIGSLVHLGPDYNLTLIGDGEERSSLELLASEAGVSSRVDFKGFLSHSEVRKELLQADLMVHCSASETFGLVFTEAANVGLQVVATTSSVAELMIPALVPGRTTAADPVAIARAVEAQLAERVDNETLRSSNVARSMMMSPDVVLASWRSTIDQVAQLNRDKHRKAIRGAK